MSNVPPYPPQQPGAPAGQPGGATGQRIVGWAQQHKVAAGCLGIIAVLVVCGAIGGIASAIGGSGSNSNSGGQAAATATRAGPTATPLPPTATPKPKSWVTVQHFTGSQNQQTTTFHLPDGSRIVWSETLTDTNANFFSIEMYNSDGSINDLIVNNANQAANQSSTYNVHGDQDVYLKVTADSVNYDIAVQVYQ